MATVLPGTKATYQIFDKEKFALMKKGAFFINAGRGSAVVEDDLIEALNSNHLAGAAITTNKCFMADKKSAYYTTYSRSISFGKDLRQYSEYR